jgi:Zn-dependent protease
MPLFPRLHNIVRARNRSYGASLWLTLVAIFHLIVVALIYEVCLRIPFVFLRNVCEELLHALHYAAMGVYGVGVYLCRLVPYGLLGGLDTQELTVDEFVQKARNGEV